MADDVIFERAEEWAAKTDKFANSLTDISPSPGTELRGKYWYRRWQAFATAVLKIESRADQTPTCHDVIRFLALLPDIIKGRGSSGKMAYSVVKSAQFSLIHILGFRHPGLDFTMHERIRLNTAVEQLYRDGVITKDPVRQKQWLGCQLIKKLATGLISDAVNNGTKSWDYTVASCFALVLQSALCTRAGDVMRSAHYTGEQYLKWRDIHLIAHTDGEGNVKMRMLVKLFYRKGQKFEPGEAMEVELAQLDDDNSVVDPTKLCVAYALRIGRVAETNWPDLIQAVLNRPSKRFIWTEPDQPVFYGSTRNESLDFTNPASAEWQNRALNHAAHIAGLQEKVTSHDIRRGAASDLFELPNTDGLGGSERARRGVGHSMGAFNRGVTDRYIGRTRRDGWGARVKQTDNASNSERATRELGHSLTAHSPGETERRDGWGARVDHNDNAPVDPFGIQMAPTSFERRKVENKDVNRYCEKNGLDKKRRNARHCARQALWKAQYDQWAEQHTSVSDGVQSSATTTIASSHSAAARVPLRDITNRTGTARNGNDEYQDDEYQDGEYQDDEYQDDEYQDDEDQDDEYEDDNSHTDNDVSSTELGNTNPNTVALTNDMLALYNGGQEARDTEGIDSMTDDCIFLWSSNTSVDPDFLTATPDKFIGRLSTINFVSVSSTWSHSRPGDMVSGGSRDPPTRFLFHCRKQLCGRMFQTRLRRDQHEVNCRPDPYAHLRRSNDRKEVVDDDGVTKKSAFSRTSRAPRRKRKICEDSDDDDDECTSKQSARAPTRVRKICEDTDDDDECGEGMMMKSTKIAIAAGAPQRKRAKIDIHKAVEGFPKTCPDNDVCGVMKTFANPSYLANHRRLHHDPKWPRETPCNFPGCQLPRFHYFVSREMFRRHLNSYHHLTSDQAREHINRIVPDLAEFRAPRGISKTFLMTMCLFPDCKTDAEFASYSDYTLHLHRVHGLEKDQYPRYMPTGDTVRLHPRPECVDTTSPVDRIFIADSPCSHPDCDDSVSKFRTFSDRPHLNRHLRRIHGVAEEDCAKYYPGMEIAPFHGTQCLHPDCKDNRRFFPTEKQYKSHLNNKHKKSTLAEVNQYQLWWKRKYE